MDREYAWMLIGAGLSFTMQVLYDALGEFSKFSMKALFGLLMSFALLSYVAWITRKSKSPSSRP